MSYQRTRKTATINLLSILGLTQSFPARTRLGLCQYNPVSHNQKTYFMGFSASLALHIPDSRLINWAKRQGAKPSA